MNDLAGSVVIARFCILGEAPDDLLEHIAHGHVVDMPWVKIKLGELTNDTRKLGAFVHLRYLFVELEVRKDLFDVWREGIDIGREVLMELGCIAQQLCKRPAARIVESVA